MVLITHFVCPNMVFANVYATPILDDTGLKFTDILVLVYFNFALKSSQMAPAGTPRER